MSGTSKERGAVGFIDEVRPTLLGDSRQGTDHSKVGPSSSLVQVPSCRQLSVDGRMNAF